MLNSLKNLDAPPQGGFLQRKQGAGPGQALPQLEDLVLPPSYMESRFGYDFSQVPAEEEKIILTSIPSFFLLMPPIESAKEGPKDEKDIGAKADNGSKEGVRSKANPIEGSIQIGGEAALNEEGGAQAVEVEGEVEKENIGSLGASLKYSRDSSTEFNLEATYLVNPWRYKQDKAFHLKFFKEFGAKGGLALDPTVKNWLVPALLGELSASVLSVEFEKRGFSVGAGFTPFVGGNLEPEGPKDEYGKRIFNLGAEIGGDAKYQFRKIPVYVFLSGSFRVTYHREAAHMNTPAQRGGGFDISVIGGLGITLSREKNE